MRINWPVTLLTLSLFMTGAAGLVTEYVLSTVSSYILGNSIEQFSITIALMLGFMGVGGWFQKYVSSENLINKFVILEVILVLASSLSPILIYMAFSYAPSHFALIYYFFVVLIGFLIGFEIPFITRINEKYVPSLKDNMAFVISADYLGSLVGAFVWVYFLLPFFPLTQISFLVAGANFFVAIITYLYFSGVAGTRRFGWGVLFLVVTLILVFGFKNVGQWSVTAEQKLYSDPVVNSTTTKYQHLVITRNNELKDTRLYINGNTQFSSTDEVRYHELLVHPVMEAGPHESVLILGGGDGLAIRELKKHDVKNIVLIDIDKDMIQFSKSNPYLLELNEDAFADFNELNLFNLSKAINFLSEGVAEGNHVFYTDAGTFVNAHAFARKESSKVPLFDVIIIDLPDPSTLELNKLYTKEFYKRLQGLLSPEGRMVVQSTSPYHAKEAFLMIGRTLAETGMDIVPFHQNIPSFGDWGWWMVLPDASVLSSLEFDPSLQYLDRRVWNQSLVFGKNELTSENLEVNQLIHPVLMRIYNDYSWRLY